MIYGFMTLRDKDASETKFLTLTESVLDAIDGWRNFSIPEAITYGIGPANLRRYQIRQFGSHMCHYVEITLQAEIKKIVNYA